MKVAVQCRSLLLQKSLETFLVGHLTTPNKCDVIISDEVIPSCDKCLRIGSDKEADIVKPFSKSQLFLVLENFYKNSQEAHQAVEIAQAMDDEDQTVLLDEEGIPTVENEYIDERGTLEDKIERLTAQYVRAVVSIVKEHYAKA